MKTQDDSGTHATLAGQEDASDHQELPQGSNLGRYVIIEPIGSGGMGTVYREYDPQLNRGVALKILSVKHADIQTSEKAKARLIGRCLNKTRYHFIVGWNKTPCDDNKWNLFF